MSTAHSGHAQRILNGTLRKNTLLTRALFNVRLHEGERIHWDFTTLVLRRALLRSAMPGMRVLEIGTGPYALLPRFLERHRPCHIEVCDINPDYVEQARRQLATEPSHIHVLQSDLFENITQRYDLVFSNTLYIPREEGTRRGIDSMHERDSDWCGGTTGYEFIDRLLSSAPDHLLHGGQLLLGFNTMYLDADELKRLCERREFHVVQETHMLMNPSRVLHLQFVGNTRGEEAERRMTIKHEEQA
jgi:methylase of polypeptide subunit release factors